MAKTSNIKNARNAFAVVLALVFFAFAGALVGSALFTPDPRVEHITSVDNDKVVFRVDSLGSDGQPGNTTVTYSPDGKNNVEVGEIRDTFSVELPDNALASLTFTNGEGTLATAYAYRQGVTVDEKTVGPNSWEQVRN